jgi:hypothetical protein
MSYTIRKLSEMTDEAAFERLATAILRDGRLDYASLLHPGVNTEDKTVRSPVDGIGFVPGAKPPHMIAAHHTTCTRNGLRKKWLHDPASVIPKKGGRPTMPAGDLIKTAEIVKTERTRYATLRATLILTTNQEPPDDLVRDTQAEGQARGLDIDIWSVSRLAHRLDTTRSGQWLRYQYLGIDQERLSQELLAKLSRDNLGIHRPDDDPNAWVSTTLDRVIAEALQKQDALFIIAESGLGKSVACYKRLKEHVAGGGFGLILPHQVVNSALTIEQAVEAALLQLHPKFLAGCGLDALSFCSVDHPLLMVVEDINRSGQAPFLAEKLVKWSSVGRAPGSFDSASGGRFDRGRWRLLCPIWPEIVASLGDTTQKQLQSLALVGAALTMKEGREAVQLRARSKGLLLSDLDADLVSEALGHDPLLIALHEPGNHPQPECVIEQFMNASAGRLAIKRGEYTASDYRHALRSMAGEMLSHRELGPSWPGLLVWVAGSGETSVMLRHLVHHGEIIRLSGPATKEIIAFRHDRVRDALFGEAIASMIRSGTLSDGLLAEPYFAEVIGAALLYDEIPLAIVDRVLAANPLALFHTLRLFREPSASIHHAVLSAIEVWLADTKTHAPQNSHLRREALAALSRTESSKVVGLVRKFKDTIWTAWQALFINGDIAGGLQLCLKVEPGVGAIWRDRQIDHAKMRFGSQLGATIGQLLRNPDLDNGVRVGALRLAGYWADPKLAESIEASWKFDAERSKNLGDYLWAAAQCCGDDPDRFLGPVCESWAALPSDRNDNMPSPRDDLAAHEIRWAFHKDIPVSALNYFINRAKNDDLRWHITYMLHGLDHPDAVEFVIHELAETDRRLEGTDRFSPFSISATDDWRRRQEDEGRPMSRESRNRLLSLWRNPDNDKFIRKQAFRIWASTETDGDLDILRSVDSSDPLAESALWERLKRSDRTAVPGLLLKLKGGANKRSFWWQYVRAIWCGELRDALEEELSARRASTSRAWGTTSDTDHQISALIMALAPSQAEALLLAHWDHLQFSDGFVQAALYVATPSLLSQVEQAMKKCPNPGAMFKHIHFQYGIRTKGQTGVTHKKQFEALGPYLDYMEDSTIHAFWEECNEHGWFDLRRKLFDHRLGNQYIRAYVNENQIISSLDKLVLDKQVHWIDYWIEDYVKSGISPAEVIQVIGKWLDARRTFSALQLAAMAVVDIGRRHDLQILAVPIEPKDAADVLRADTAFAVKRRSLR